MTKGVYGYFDVENEEIVYIGLDSYIDKNQRHKAHMRPSKYNDQRINRVLQNNPDRYIYKPIYICPPHLTDLDLKGLEMQYIEALNPKFNFTKGGDGALGFKHTQEARRKMSEARKGEKHPMWNKYCSEETRKKMSEAHNTSGYYRVYKHKDKKCKQGFRWSYGYYENRKRKHITSTNIKKLEEKVKAKGLPWYKKQRRTI